MRAKGKITSWNDDKGFGFITPLGGGKRVFVHVKAFRNRGRRPQTGEMVTYAVSRDRRGRPRAEQATLAGDRLGRETKRPNESLPVAVAVIFLVLLLGTVLTSKVPMLLLAVYLVASLVTYAAYALDKSAAKNDTWRTKENTLHLLSLAGGWPGAVVAQKRLRHKSRKASFQAVFWVTVFTNIGIFAWLLTPTGSQTMQIVLAKLT